MPFYGGPSSDEEPTGEANEEVDEGANEEINEEAPPVQEKVKKRGNKTGQQKLISMFMNMNFLGTRYPHQATMKELSILADVEFMTRKCNLETFFTYNLEGYKEETCHFLASLNVHTYENEEDFEPTTEGLGYITFEIRGQPFSLTFVEIDKLFGFTSGTEAEQDFDKAELTDLWREISGKDTYSSSRSKSSHISNPAIRYFHKSIANTFFARRVTGNINEGELQLLDLALKDLLNQTSSLRVMEGDRSHTGLTTVLLHQLLHYREWAIRMYTMGTKGDLCIGGIITPFLYACGVNLESRPTPQRWMDIQYLKKAKFLDKKQGDAQHLYHFHHPTEGESMIALPNPRFTKMRQGNNITFNPPAECLFRHSSPREDIEEEQQPPFEQNEHEPSASTTRLQEAEKRIGVLEKISKWQKRTIKGLKNTVKEMGEQIKELTNIVNCTSTRQEAHVPMAMERSRSSSAANRRHISVEPSRASSSHRNEPVHGSPAHSTSRLDLNVELTGSIGTGSTWPLDHYVEPTQQQMSNSTWPLDFDVEPAQATRDQALQSSHHSSSTSRADQSIYSAPSTLAYDRESMDASVTSFFSKP